MTQKEKIKLPEIFDFEEKKKFIEILLIVGGILTAFNTEKNNLITLFVLFTIACLGYLIILTIFHKMKPEDKSRLRKNFSVYLSMITAFVAFSFSFLIAIISLQGTVINNITDFSSTMLFGFALYILLGFIIWVVLYKDKSLDKIGLR